MFYCVTTLDQSRFSVTFLTLMNRKRPFEVKTDPYKVITNIQNTCLNKYTPLSSQYLVDALLCLTESWNFQIQVYHFVEIGFHFDIQGCLSVDRYQNSHIKCNLIQCCMTMIHDNFQRGCILFIATVFHP